MAAETPSTVAELCRMPDRREAWYRLADRYRCTDEPARRAIEAGYPFDVFWHGPEPEHVLLPDEDARLPADRVLTFIVHAVMSYDRAWFREWLMAVSRDVHWAAALGVDTAAWCERLAQLARPEVAANLRRFIDLSHPDASFDAWRLRRVETPHGPWIMWRT